MTPPDEAITLAAGLSSLRGLLGASAAHWLNGPLRDKRQSVQARTSLTDVKTIRRVLGRTVDDVLLAAVSGGSRAPARTQRTLLAELTVRTLVPLSLRTLDARGIPDDRMSALAQSSPWPTGPRRTAGAITIELDTLKRSRTGRHHRQRDDPALACPHRHWSRSAPAP